MSKNNENKLVPKLRFPEFENHGEWNEKSFIQLFEFGNGKDYKHLSSGDIPVYGTGGKMLLVNDYLYDGESVCIGRKGTIDNPLFLTGKFWTVDTLFYTHSFVKCIPKFIYYVFLKIDWYNYNEAGGVPSLSKTTISKIKVLIPPKIEEQQKIAACLSSLDEVITAESQKLEVLKEHKKGLLQNLFPSSGTGLRRLQDEQDKEEILAISTSYKSCSDNVPKFRFKEFEDSGEWEETTLTQVASFVNNKTQLENLTINSYISTENLLPDYAGVALASKLPSSGNFTKYQKGDILVSNIRPYLKKVWFADKDGACSNDVIVIRATSFISSQFLSNLLKNDAFIGYIMKNVEGVKMPRGDKDSIREYPIVFPKNPKEQEKIADTLSSVDDLINAQNQKIEALQWHKRGLLQGLFPQMSETGLSGLNDEQDENT